MKSELLTGGSVKTSCEKIDVIHEKVSSGNHPSKIQTRFCSKTFFERHCKNDIGVILILKKQ